MRILSVSHMVRDAGGGAASATLQLNDAIRRQGHAVTDVFSDDVLAIPGGRRARETLPLVVARTVTGLAREFDVIVITGHAGWVAFPWLRGLRRGPGLPLLVSQSYGLEHFDHAARREEQRAGRLHLSLPYRLGGGFVTLREVELTIAASDLFAASRPGAARWAVDRHLKRPRGCLVAGFGVSDDLFDVTRSAVDPNRVAWVGSTVERKGWADFVEGFSTASGTRPALTASIFGTGRTAADVAADFDPAVRPRLDVQPRLEAATLFDQLSACACFVSASLSEGYHLAVLQAMALGVPVIATAEGFLADLDPSLGALYHQIPKRCPQALSAGVLLATASSESPATEDWQMLASRAKGFARSRSWDRVAEATLEGYGAALARA